MDHDINFANESVEPSLPFPNPPLVNSETTVVTNNFSPGTGLLWIPGFLIGQLLTITLSVFGLPVLSNGYSLMTQIIVGLSTVGFGILGVYSFVCGLAKLFPKKIVTRTTVSLLLTTQLLYYLAIDPLNSHSASFLFSSISFLLWVQVWQKRVITWKQAVLLGLSLGTLALIRNQDVLTGVILITSLFFRISQKTSALQRLSLAILTATAACSIQLFTSWILYHSWQSPYVLSGQVFYWFSPDFLRVLFSPGNGFFHYAPVAVLSLMGLFLFAKQQRNIAIIFLVLFFSQLYVIASWGSEIVGGPYGSRMFVGVLPFLGVGLAYMLTKLSVRWWFFGTGALFLWNVYQIGEMLMRW